MITPTGNRKMERALKTYEVEFQIPEGCRMAYVEATGEDAARQQVLDSWPLAQVRCVFEMETNGTEAEAAWHAWSGQ